MKPYSCFLLPLLLIPFGSFNPHPEPFNDFEVTVTGFFFGFDGTTKSQVSLAGARVELMDSDALGSELFDDVMGVDVIQPDGSFKVTGRGGDPGGFSWSKPDVYIRIVYNNDKGIRLTDELNNDRTANTPEHDHDDFEGSLDIGTWQTDVGADGGTWSSVWRAGCDAWTEFQAIMGGENPPSGKLDIEYWSSIWVGTPWTNDNTMHWPIDFPRFSMRHEFGHLIRHAADGDRQHFDWDANRFRYGRFHDNPCDMNCNRLPGENREKGLGYGFNEGWADFWANETGGCSLPIDDECEGNARAALAQVSKNIGGKKKMVEVLKANPFKIHSVDEFVEATAVTHSLNIKTLKELLMQRPDASPTEIKKNIRLDKTRQLRKIQSLISQDEKEMTMLKSKINKARENVRVTKPCNKENDCYNWFQANILPVTLKLEYLLKQAEVARMKKAASRSWLKSAFENPDQGNLDSLYTIERKKNQMEATEIIKNSYAELIKTVQQLKKQSKQSEILAADFEKKYDVLLNQIKEYGQLPSTLVMPRFSWEGKCQSVKPKSGK